MMMWMNYLIFLAITLLLTVSTSAAPLTNNFSMSFDGQNDFVVTPVRDSDINQLNGGTVTLWIKYHALNSHPSGPAGSPAFSESFGEFNVGIENNQIGFGIFDGSRNDLSSGVTPELNRWYHIAVKWGPDAGGQFIYIDGELKNSNTNTAQPRVPANEDPRLMFGRADRSNGARHLDGAIDELSIYNDPLTDQEIQDLATAERNPGEFNSIVNWWRFEEGEGTVASDIIGVQNGAIQNGATFSTDVPFSTTVPEPSSLLLCGLGMLGWVWFRNN